jgi:hypothetical protein
VTVGGARGAPHQLLRLVGEVGAVDRNWIFARSTALPVSVSTPGEMMSVRPFGATILVIDGWTPCTTAPQLASLR